MNKHSMIFIGLDTHKEFHEVVYCEEQRERRRFIMGVFPRLRSVSKSLFASLNLNILA